MKAAPIVALGLALLAPAAGANDPAGEVKVDGDVWNMTLEARLFDGLPQKVLVAGAVAYAALDSGIASYDLTDLASPRQLGRLYLPGAALDLALDGQVLYVADGEWGLSVIDVSDPARPVAIGSATLGGAVRGIAVAGGIACLAVATEKPAPVYGLYTVDVGDPRSPTPIGFVALANGALDVALAGSIAWVGIGSNPGLPALGLVAVDVSDPLSPVAAGSLDLARPVNEIAIDGSVAYLAAGLPSAGALVSVAIADPAAPAVLGEVLLADAARGVAVRAGQAWVAARALGLVGVDVTDPARPVVRRSLPTGREAVGVASRGDIAVLAERASIERASLTVIDTPSLDSSVQLGCASFAEATGAAAGSGLALLLRRDALSVFDATSPALPVPLGEWRPQRGDLVSVVAAAGLAAVSEGAEVHLLDLYDPSNPTEVGQVQVSIGQAGVARLAGDVLHVVTGLGLESFDVSSPAAPVALGAYRAAGWTSSLAMDGAIGYLAEGDTLRVLDLSAPGSPRAIGALTLAGERIAGVAVGSGLAVVTGLANLLYVVDVANPAAPVLSGFVAGGQGFEVSLAGDRAIVAGGEAGVSVVDLGDPTQPRVEAAMDLSGAVYALARDGATVYAAAGAGQHWILGCATCAATGCVETWPVPAANSLRIGRVARTPLLGWQIASGSGLVDLHRTGDATLLPSIWAIATSIAGASATGQFADPVEPAAGAVLFYQVFGRGSCSGVSHGP